jgi:hypothetical protein
MKVKLLDFDKNVSWVKLPDDTKIVCGVILSGDMVMIHPSQFDTGEGSRWHSVYEGSWSVDVQNIEDFNKIKNSYEALDFLI